MNWVKHFWEGLTTPQPLPESYEFGEGFSHFTPRAIQVLKLARKEAERLDHNFVGTEHLLLGLITLGQGPAIIVLEKMGLNLRSLRSEIEKNALGRGAKLVGTTHIPFTPRVKRVLALAEKERKALKHHLSWD